MIKANYTKVIAVEVQFWKNANYFQNHGYSLESWLRQGRNVCILAAILMVVPFCGGQAKIWLAQTCLVDE